jgi:hypothetical protein
MAQGCVAKALLAPWPLLRPGVAEGRSKNLRNNLMSLQHMHQAPRCGARILAEHRRCPMGAAVSTEESRRAHLAETQTRLSTGATRQRRSHNGGRWPLSFGKRNRWRIFLCHRLLSGRRAAAPQPAGVTREQPWPLKLVAPATARMSSARGTCCRCRSRPSLAGQSGRPAWECRRKSSS